MSYFKNNGTNYTQVLAEYAANLTYDKIPAEVIERAKLMTLHTLGVSLAAKMDELAQNAVKIGSELNNGVGGSATVWTTGEKLSPANAVFVNGTISDILDWEDCSWTGHPSASAVPVSIAVAEDQHSTGKEYLAALIACFEVCMRVSMAVQPGPDFDHNQGWAISNWNIWAATTAAAKLMGLDATQIDKAFGLSCHFAEMASNMQQATMSNAYHYQWGHVSQSGIEAALCAKYGIANMQGCFDIPYGYCEQLTDAVDRSWLNKDMDQFMIMEILIKHWPANMWVQNPVELVADMTKKYSIKPEDIEEIVINPPIQYRMHCPEKGYSSLMEAQFSTPFVIASYLLDPTPNPNWFTPDKFNEPRIMELAKRVKGGTDPEDTLLHSFNVFQGGSHPEKTVTITTKDGKVYEESMRFHKGHPKNMLSREEFVELFRMNAGQYYSAPTVEKLIDFVLNIEKVENIAAFGELLK